MSKKRPGRKSSARPDKKSSASLSSNPRRVPMLRSRRRAIDAVALLLASIAATGIVAAQGGLGNLVSAPSALRKLAARASSPSRSTSKSASPMQSPTPLPLTKEYIYAGGKLIATEEPPVATGPIPHIGSINQTSANPGDNINPFNLDSEIKKH
jgi:hypothetical protein